MKSSVFGSVTILVFLGTVNELISAAATVQCVVTVAANEQVIAIADYFIQNPSALEMLLKLAGEARHPLSMERARKILIYAKDPQLVLKWQKVLVPHMQTNLLKRLRLQPTPWTDLPLVEKELFKRSDKYKTVI